MLTTPSARVPNFECWLKSNRPPRTEQGLADNLAERDLTIKEISKLFTVYPPSLTGMRTASADKRFTIHGSRFNVDISGGLLIQRLLDLVRQFLHACLKLFGFLEHGHKLIRDVK